MRINGNDMASIYEKYTKLDEAGCVANTGEGTPSVMVVDAPGSRAAGGINVPKGRYPGKISNVGVSGAQPSAYENNEEEACGQEQVDMAKTQLLVSADRAVEIFEKLHSGCSIEPWAASKITLAADYIQTVADYMKYKNTNDSDAPNPQQIEVIPLKLEKIKINDLRLEKKKQRLDPKCWKGYTKKGTKMKGGVRVNNCVKVKK
jgi:hypothetical protein